MKGTVVTFLVVFAAMSFMHGVALGQDTKTAEQLAQENLEAFREWRQGIPDYEKRLYDRVKSINKRMVTIQSVTIIGMALILIINLGTLFLIVKWRGGYPRSITTPEEKLQKDRMRLAGIMETERKFRRSIAERADRIRLKNLSRRQIELKNAVMELESFVASTDGSNEELDKLMKSIKDWVQEIQKEVDETVAKTQAID